MTDTTVKQENVPFLYNGTDVNSGDGDDGVSGAVVNITIMSAHLMNFKTEQSNQRLVN